MKYLLLLLLLACSTKPQLNKEMPTDTELRRVQFHFLQSSDEWVDVSYHREKWIVPSSIASGVFALSVTGFDEISKIVGGTAFGGFITWGGYTWLKEVDGENVYQLNKCLSKDVFHHDVTQEFKAIQKVSQKTYLNTSVVTKHDYDDYLQEFAPVFQVDTFRTTHQVAVVYQLNFARNEETGDPMAQILYRLVVYDDLKKEITHDELRVVDSPSEYTYSWQLLLQNNCALTESLLEPLIIRFTQDVCNRLKMSCYFKRPHASRSRWGKF
jgi:hypothetical protein